MRLPRSPLVRSLGLHAVLLTGVMLGWFLRAPELRQALSVPGESRWTIDVSEPASPAKRGRALHAYPSLKHLGVPLPGLPGSAAPSPSNAPADSEPAWTSGDPLAPETDRDVSLYRYLYSVIERNLTYPAEFHGTGIQGEVTVTLRFDSEGAWRKDVSAFRASNPYLRVHVIRLLRKALRERIPANLWKARAKLAVDCTFRFLISESGDVALLESKRVIFGKSLSFARRIQKSVLEWQAGPLHGLGPFAVSLNPLWFFEKARDVVAPRIKIDPLEKYRNDPDW